jgi:transketolase
MEGVTSEAASLAGHLGLGKLIYLYDDNRITIDGSTDIAFTENVGQRFEAYGWHVQRVDGNDVSMIEAALSAARAEHERPSLIMARTHIAYGSPNKQDTAEAHGSPLGDEEIRLTKEALGWPLEPTFYVPDEALTHFREAVSRGGAWEAEWQAGCDAYAAAYPELADEWTRVMSGQLPEGWTEKIPTFTPAGGGLATREASGKVLNAIASSIPTLIGGSADLTPSNNTHLKGGGDFQKSSPGGRNLHFGVREHAMGSILNGMALHQGVIPYAGTFLVFSDYVRPAIRVAALSHIHAIYVFTHDSIGLGEDGPTHQPIEHLSSLRAMPNLTVIRPADATETAVAWRAALEHRSGPVVLALTRQKLPILDRTKFPSAELLLKGAYVLADADQSRPRIILIATGSEVHLALEAWGRLAGEGVPARVVSMPSWELFDRQTEAYRNEVLPPTVTARLAIETGSPHGWHRYVGLHGGVIGMTRFGASAPYQVLMQQFGFTVEHVVSRAMELLA